MRLLSLKAPKVAKQIYRKLKDELVAYDDDDKTLSVMQVRALSGKEEGFYAWIAANSLLGSFNSSDETVGKCS